MAEDFVYPEIGAPPSRRSQSKMRIRKLLDESTDTAALSFPAITATRPTTGAVQTDDFPNVRLFFGGRNAADETVNYQVILWRQFDSASGRVWVPTIVCKGQYTLGTLVYGSEGYLGNATDGYWADGITEEKGGGVVHSPGNNEIAWMDVDVQNAEILQVETDLGTAAQADVFHQLAESPLQWTMDRSEPILFSAADQSGAGALAITIAPYVPFTLLQCRLHVSADPGGASLLTAIVDSSQGPLYDTLLTSEDVNANTSLVVSYGENYKFRATDEVDFSYANTGGKNCGMEIAYKLNLP
jgi:hypothetical protein